MAYLLPHLKSGWEVDQAIVTAEDRVVVIRFGHDQDQTCMVQDEILMSIADKVSCFFLFLFFEFNTASFVIFLNENNLFMEWEHSPSLLNTFLLFLLYTTTKVKNFAVIYLVDTTEVPDFNNMYELFDE
jgi:DIM1 family U5 snRNP protein